MIKHRGLARTLLLAGAFLLPAHGHAAPTAKLLYTFPFDETLPAPTLGANGALFGTTAHGGGGYGTIYELTPPSTSQGSWTQSTLLALSPGDGAMPMDSVTVAGNSIYGTTYNRGKYDGGTVFRLLPPLHGGTTWRFSRLHNFSGPVDGIYAYASPFVDAVGDVFASTTRGKPHNAGDVVELTPPKPGTSVWSEAIINPYGDQTKLVSDGHGGFYQIASNGVFYHLQPPAPPATVWSSTQIFLPKGPTCFGPPVADGSGNAFAVAACDANGRNAASVVVEFSPPIGQGAAWTETVIYAPSAQAVMEDHDLLVTPDGRVDGILNTSPNNQAPAIFELTPLSGNAPNWSAAILFTFDPTGQDEPSNTGFVRDVNGNFYYCGHLFGSSDSAVFEVGN